jgi:ABC-type nitrate/sulfonate/bicarbonate transport system substrate-binding protein
MRRYVLVFMALLLAFGCSQSEQQSTSIRYGGQYYPEEFLLEGYDFFSEFGLQVEHTLFSSGTENNEALISGNVDFNVGSDSKTVALFSALGKKAVIIGTVQRGNRYSTMVRADSNYTAWEALKGKKVGTRFGSGAEFVLKKFFDETEGLSWSDFEWINLKTEDMIAALANGQIEAFTVWAPTGEIAEAQGIARLLMNYGDIALTPVQIHTTVEFAENNPELVAKFLAAHLKKAEMIKQNPEQAAEYAVRAARARDIDVPAEAFRIIFERIDFSIEFDEDVIRELPETARFLKEQGEIDEIPPFQYDLKYLEMAKKLI